MTSLEYSSLERVIEFQLPYMFANPKSIDEKINIPRLIKDLESEKDNISLNIKFPIIISKQDDISHLKLLINIRKFKNKKTGEIKTKPEIIGVIKNQYTYEALADFHFESKIPQEKLINHFKTYLSISEIPNPTEENFLNNLPYRNLCYSILPANFSKAHNHFITHHKILTDDYETALSTQKIKKEDKTRFVAKFIHFEDYDVPIPEQIPDSVENRPEYKYLMEKFEARPIYLKNVLIYEARDKFKFESYHIFKKVLSFIAYSFKDGPWKHAYVRFKHDPRADPNSYIYQVVDVGAYDGQSKNDGLSQPYKRYEFDSYDPHFNDPPTKLRQIYQLCDLKDAQILDILQKEKESIEKNDNIICDKKNGWVSDKTLRSILKFMKSKFKLN